MSDEIKKLTETLNDVEVFAVGTWNKDKYIEKDLQQMVDNFSSLREIVKPPAKIGHSEEQELLKKEGLPAAGWVDSLKLVGGKLVATFKDVPKVVKDLITKKAYRRVSAEIYPKYKSPVDGKIYKNVLRAVAFLGADIPAVESLTDIQNLYAMQNGADGTEYNKYSIDLDKLENYNKGGMNIMGKWKVLIEGSNKEELTKKFSEALGEAVKFEVVEEAPPISEEEKKKQDEEKAAKDKAAQDEKDKTIKVIDEKNKEVEEMAQKAECLSKKVEETTTQLSEKDKEVLSYQEKIKSYEEQLTKVKKDYEIAQAELTLIKKNAKSEAVKAFVKECEVEGKILPRDSENIIALMEQLDETQVVKFTKEGKESTEQLSEVIKKFIKNLPKAVEFKEVSPQGESDHKEFEDKINVGGVTYEVRNLELVQKAEKYAKEKEVSFEAAVLEVTKNEQTQ